MTKANSTNSSTSRTLKMVITLKSGKSIVNNAFEDKCFNIYNQWINYKIPKDDSVDKVIIEKKSGNMIMEVISILTSEIASIQITDDAFFDKGKK
jgi:hypothetical protein